MKRLLLIGILMTGSLLAGSPAWAATYAIDKDHTTIGFKIRHLFSKVEGRFDDFQGTIEYEPGTPDMWKTEAVIQAASINTHVAQRDKHLRSKDFFDAEQYPTMTFKSTGVKNATAEGGQMEGLLSIHGVERPVTLSLQIHGAGKDPWGNVRAGFTATTRINRKDFGLTWNEVIEGGQLLVGDEVDITLEVEGIAK